MACLPALAVALDQGLELLFRRGSTPFGSAQGPPLTKHFARALAILQQVLDESRADIEEDQAGKKAPDTPPMSGHPLFL